jgi:hypothetical protein
LLNAIEEDEKIWPAQLLRRIDKTIKKGRFVQELSLLIDGEFTAPRYLEAAIEQIITAKKIR